MATTTLTVSPQTITVSGTSDNEIDFKNMLAKGVVIGTAFIKVISGTAVRFNAKGEVDDTNSTVYTAGDEVPPLQIKQGTNLHYKGGAGSETFSISIVS